MSEPNFHAFLSAQPGVQSLVGLRIYTDKLGGGGAVPGVVTQRVGGLRQQRYCGADGLVLGSFQFDVYAKTRAACNEVAEAIRAVMQDFSGTMGATPVKHCHLTSDFDSVDPEPGLLRKTQLWDVWYAEA